MPLALPLRFLLAIFAGWVNRAQQDVIDYLRTENAVLLEQLGARGRRLTDEQRRRLAVEGKILGRKVLSQVAGIVTPDTILRWYRNLVARKYDRSSVRGHARDRRSVVDVLLRLAREEPTWGYTRLRDALSNLELQVSRKTVARILRDHGIEPAPERGRGARWREFLAAHWEGLAAADFFTVEVVTWMGLVRYFVLFVMELKTRRVHVAGITRSPDQEWMKQVRQEPHGCGRRFLAGLTHLILDRDPLYSAAFREILRGRGLSIVRLPPRSPDLNCYAERWIRSIRQELLDRIVPLGEGHLRWAIKNYLAHYHAERNHQGLESRIIEPEPGVPSHEGRIVRRRRVGGMLSYYYREAS
ncbi:IS3 family transposase [bacterium]|nr:IS3 family transposase [bacterium]